MEGIKIVKVKKGQNEAIFIDVRVPLKVIASLISVPLIVQLINALTQLIYAVSTLINTSPS